MKYIVYLTTNLKTREIYIGVHKTENPDIFDGYYGCGIYRGDPLKNPKTKFQYAIKKYGYDAFERRTLKVFDSYQDAYALEAELVTEEFIKRPDVYNMVTGGKIPDNTKPVYKYTLEGKFIKGWNSIIDAANEHNINGTIISQAAIYNTTALKALWSFVKTDQLQLNDYTIYNPDKKVYLYDLEGNFYKSFNTMSELARKFDTSISHINRAVDLGIKLKGYYVAFEFIKNYKPKEQSPKLSGIIHQYNLDGSYIKSFNSIKEVEKEFNENMRGINPSIRQGKQYKGFIWRRGEKQESVQPIKITNGIARKVGQYDLKGTLIKVFDSVRLAREEFPSVSRVLKGWQKQCHGYTFKYIS